MKKRVLSWLLTILLAFSLVTPADKAYAAGNEGSGSEQEQLEYEAVFPDAAFRQQICVGYGFDADNDGIIDDDELEAMAQREVLMLGLSEYYPDPIESLKGIEFFSGLKTLYVNDCGLKSLDITGNTQLKELNCKNNRIETLDLGVNSLTNVWCQGNPGITIDIRNHALLNQAYIKALAGPMGIIPDPDGNFGVSAAEWNEEQNGFDVCASVTYSQDATVLYTPSDPGQQDPGEEEQTLEEMFPDPTFRAIVMFLYDSDKDGKLSEEEWTVIENETVLFLATDAFDHPGFDVKPVEDDATIETLQGVELFPNITMLTCGGRGVKTLDISKNTKLEYLYCQNNNLTELDLGIESLQTVYCFGNEELEINLWGNPGLCKAYKKFLTNGGITTEDGYYQADYQEEIPGEEYGQSYMMVFSQDAVVNYDDSYDIGNQENDYDPWYDILSEYDVDNDGVLSDEELAVVTTLTLDYWYESLDGIERLVNLEVLNCSGHQLTSADLSQNTKLKELTLYTPGLTSIDLSNNMDLTKVNISGPFATLDFSSNTKLESLSITGYVGEELFSMEGLSGLKSLTLCECAFTDVSGIAALTGLEELSLVMIGVTTLDVSTLINLKALNCHDGVLEEIIGLDNLTSLETLEVAINNLTALDVSRLPNLKKLYCSENNLTSLKVGKQTFEIFYANTNKNLQSIDGFENITVTKYLGIGQTSIGTLDVSRFADLQYLYCFKCGLEELNVDANTELLLLDCSGNDIENLVITNNTKLFNLYCVGNAITSLDITQNPMLLMAARGSRTEDKDGNYLYENGVGGFDLFETPMVRALYIDKTTELIQGENEPTAEEQATMAMFPDPAFRNQVFTYFDEDYNCVIDEEELANIADCEVLEIGGCGIQDLTGIEYFTGLKTLYAGANKLTTLDVSENKNLTTLSCPKNNLESVDITGIPGLITAHYGNCSQNILLDEDDPDVVYWFDQYFSYEEDGTEYSLTVDAGVKIIRPYSDGELATAELFPDHNFRSYVLSRFDADGDRALDEAELATIAECDSVMVDSLGIRSLAGIGFFTGVKELRCANNKLTTLDISKNTSLEALSCYDNDIETLNITGIQGLQKLYKYGVKSEGTIGFFDYVAQEEYEVSYDCYSIYGEDSYPFLSVDKNTEIQGAQLSEEEQLVLDRFPDPVFRGIVLGMFDDDGNFILDENEMAAIASCQTLDVGQMGIADLTGIEYFTGLTYLDCWENELTELDISANTALKYLRCTGNGLTALNISANTELVYLDCSENDLSALDIGRNKKLLHLRCFLNNLSELDISDVPNMLDAYLSGMLPVYYPVPAPTEENPEAYGEHLYYAYDNYNITTENFGYPIHAALCIDPEVKVITGLPYFSAIGMVLSEEIGLRFALTIPEGFEFSTENQSFSYSVSGTIYYIPMSEAQKLDENTFVFTCPLNPLQFADTVEAQFHWDWSFDEEWNVINDRYIRYTTSAEKYCDELDLSDEKLLNLVKSLKEYSYAVSQTNWTDGKEHLGFDVEMDDLSAEELNDLKEGILEELEESGVPIRVNLVGSGISDVQISLSLVTKTILNIYVLPEDGVEVYGYSDTREIGGQLYYLIRSEPIGPLNLGLMQTYSIGTSAGTAVINACPLSYVYSFMSVSADDAKILAMAKYFEYYKSAVAYENSQMN